jgi:menaquinone-dependent protoporphyrinogen oxidase
MRANVLVTFASKHGFTEEIAQKIGQTLAEAGHQVTVLPVKQVTDLNPYTAVLLGSGVYAGMWMRPAAKFLKKNEAALTARTVWLFSSGPTGEGEVDELLDGWRFPSGLQEVADRIQPKDIVVFHGAVVLEKLGAIEKWMIEKVESPVGDYRDWDAITTWARGVAEELKQPAG